MQRPVALSNQIHSARPKNRQPFGIKSLRYDTPGGKGRGEAHEHRTAAKSGRPGVTARAAKPGPKPPPTALESYGLTVFTLESNAYRAHIANAAPSISFHIGYPQPSCSQMHAWPPEILDPAESNTYNASAPVPPFPKNARTAQYR